MPIRDRWPARLRDVDVATLLRWAATPDAAPAEVRELLRSDRALIDAIADLAARRVRNTRDREHVA
jgi:hypothetical protein